MAEQTILVVEDEVLIRMLLADALREAGYQVIEAANGEEAMDILLAGQIVDLMITDVRMPGLVDGMQLTAHSKRTAPFRPVIVSSGHVLPDISHPADLVLTKPYTDEILLGAVKRLMGDSCLNESRDRHAS